MRVVQRSENEMGLQVQGANVKGKKSDSKQQDASSIEVQMGLQLIGNERFLRSLIVNAISS